MAIKIENVEVMGWEHAIRGMRNPKNSWEKIDSGFGCDVDDFCKDCGARTYGNCPGTEDYCVGPNDHDLMSRLAKGGPVHAKYRRMITVYLDITAPLYWWKEFDTYKVGTVANSCSTMHKIHDKEFTLEDFSCEHLCDKHNNLDVMGELCDELGYFTSSPMDDLIGDIKKLNAYRTLYLKCDAKLKREDLTYSERKHVISQRKLWWWQMIQRLGSNYNQKRTIMLNYEVLANIYESRKNHKLDEWRLHDTPSEHRERNKDFTSGVWGFCDWIESLPYSEIITGEVKESED